MDLHDTASGDGGITERNRLIASPSSLEKMYRSLPARQGNPEKWETRGRRHCVEAICGIALTWGITALVRKGWLGRRAAVIANLIALFGVVIGLVSLAVGAGTRTASNDLYHKLMLILIAAALLLIWFSRRLRETQN